MSRVKDVVNCRTADKMRNCELRNGNRVMVRVRVRVMTRG